MVEGKLFERFKVYPVSKLVAKTRFEGNVATFERGSLFSTSVKSLVEMAKN